MICNAIRTHTLFSFRRQADILAARSLRTNRIGGRTFRDLCIGEGESQYDGVHVDEGWSAAG